MNIINSITKKGYYLIKNFMDPEQPVYSVVIR